MTDEPNDGTDRRSFLVTMMGAVVGTFFLPQGMVEAAVEDAATTPSLDILVPPTWGLQQESNIPYLVYVDSNAEVMIWICDSSDRNHPEFKEMKRFYEACQNPGCPEVNPAEVFPIRRSPEETTLLRSIVARPDAEEPKLAYSRWLTSQGNRIGEFIEADILTERLPETDPRWQPLLDKYNELSDVCGHEIFRPLAALGLWPTMGANFVPAYWAPSGVIQKVEVSVAGVLPEQTERLFQAAPALTSLTVAFENWDVPAIVAQRELNQIISLTFHAGLDTKLTANDIQAIANSPNLGRLQSLAVDHNPIGDGLLHLTDSQLAARLTTLSAYGCEISDEIASQFFTECQLPQIESINLGGNNIGEDAMKALAQHGNLLRLVELDLQSNSELGDTAIEALVQASLPALTSLDLHSCNFTVSAVESIANWAMLENLHSLDLGGSEITDRGAKALVESGRLANLRTLRLADGNLTSRGIEAIANCKQLNQLKVLDVSGSPVDDEGAKSLADSPYLKSLDELFVDGGSLSDEAKSMLAAAFGDRVTISDDEEDDE